MSCTVHLDGKKQAVQYEEVKGQPLIIQKVIQRLLDSKEKTVRDNLQVVLRNIYELPEGKRKTIHELSTEVELLDEVFGYESISTLHELLPKLDIETPFQFNKNKMDIKYKVRLLTAGLCVRHRLFPAPVQRSGGPGCVNRNDKLHGEDRSFLRPLLRTPERSSALLETSLF